MDQIDDVTTTSGPLMVTADQVGDLADRLVGWYLFPAKVDGNKKRPLTPSWQSYAATGREAVESLWKRFGEYNEDGTYIPLAVGVACDPSGIFVIDEDKDWRPTADTPADDESRAWAAALDSTDSLVLPSSTKGRPHYYFRQPSDGKGRVAERVWIGGEIKSKGWVALSAAPPIYQPSHAGGGLWTPADVTEVIPPLAELIGRRRQFDNGTDQSSDAAYYGHRVTKEEFAAWLNQEPGEHFGGRLISEEYEDRFLEQLTDRFHKSVENGNSRRTACLAAVHQAVIESYQGLYSLSAAHDALRGAYEELRTYGPGDTSGDKGWNQRRAEDFQGMWESEVYKPDALRSAEASYDELVERFSASGVSMEISEEDKEEDAFCMDIIFAASEENVSEQDAVSTANPVPEVEPPPPGAGSVEQADDISWDEAGVVDPIPPPQPVPVPPSEAPVTLGDAAKRGVLWELAAGLVGKHELPHEALMITLAGWAGCVLGAVGAGSMYIGEDRHGPELCVCMVGTSAVSHKSGTVLFGHMVFNEWIDVFETGAGAPGVASGYFRQVSGIESGQAFIEIWPTAAEIAGGEGIGRAVMMVETELTTMWKKAARKGSTIPEEVRKAWDNTMLSVRGVRAGNHRVLPANYRFSAVGATIHTLAAQTIRESGADITGDGNRWLWCWGQEVPRPVKGQPSFDKHPLVNAIRDQVRGLIQSVERARSEGWWPGSAIGPGGVPLVEFGEPRLWWTLEADQMWLGDEGTPTAGSGIYADLRDEVGTNSIKSGVVKGLTSRNAQQVMRLAIGYEMLKAGAGWADLVRNTHRAKDGQSWCLSAEALQWGLAVWRYCADTIEHLFADTTGDAKIDELVSAIREMGRDEGTNFKGYIFKRDIVGNGFSKNSITSLLAAAESAGAIWQRTIKKEGRGAAPVVVGLSDWPIPSNVHKRVR